MPGSHVHIGTGSLGLGLIGDLANRARLNTCFVNRVSKEEYHKILSEERSYILDVDGKPQTVAGFEVVTYPERAPEQCRDVFANPDIFLITTAVKASNLDSSALVLAHGLQRRMETGCSKPLAVVACENIEDNSSYLKRKVEEELSRTGDPHEVHRNVSFCDCVVDRMCVKPVPVNEGGSKKVRVQVESYLEWTIDDSNIADDKFRRELGHEIGQFEGVRIAKRPFYQARAKRKFWCMNAIDLYVSAYAYGVVWKNLDKEKKAVIRVADAITNPEIASKVPFLQRELGYAAMAYARGHSVFEGFDLGTMNSYHAKVFDRLSKFKANRVGRILTDFIKMETEAPDAIRFFLNNLDALRNQKQGDGTADIGRTLNDAVRKIVESLEAHSFVEKVHQRIAEPIKELMDAKIKPQFALEYLLLVIQVLEVVSKNGVEDMRKTLGQAIDV